MLWIGENKVGLLGNATYSDGAMNLGGILIGLNLSSMFGILDVLAYSPNFGHLKPFEREALTAVMPAGSMLGSLASWHLVRILSPTVALQYGCLAWVLGCVAMVIMPVISGMYIGRVIAGMGVGIISAVAPVYQVMLLTRLE